MMPEAAQQLMGFMCHAWVETECRENDLNQIDQEPAKKSAEEQLVAGGEGG